MIVLKKVETPQTIFILPSGFNDESKIEPSFSITDDYSGFAVMDPKKLHHSESDGFVTIVTEEELCENIHKLWEEGSDENAYVVRDFTGEIQLKVFNDRHEDVLDPAKYDPKEYIYHQSITDGEGGHDIVIVVPCEISEVTSINKLEAKYRTSIHE